jgi:RHS repeat-associated protein
MWRYDQNANGTVASTERFFYMYDDRWRIVGAFWDSGSTPQESFVYHAAGNAGRGSSSYIDSVVMRDRDTDANGTLEERRYYVQNWRADVVAITKSNGDPLQYVVYSPYGEPVTHAVADVDLDGDVDIYDQAAWANGSPNSTFAYAALEDLNHDGTDSAADDALFDESYTDNLGLGGRGRLSSGKLDNRKGYAGYEHDESLTMYHVRHRVYRADLGRWMTRDPLGYVDGMSTYEYVAGMGVVLLDPSGLCTSCGNQPIADISPGTRPLPPIAPDRHRPLFPPSRPDLFPTQPVSPPANPGVTPESPRPTTPVRPASPPPSVPPGPTVAPQNTVVCTVLSQGLVRCCTFVAGVVLFCRVAEAPAPPPQPQPQAPPPDPLPLFPPPGPYNPESERPPGRSGWCDPLTFAELQALQDWACGNPQDVRSCEGTRPGVNCGDNLEKMARLQWCYWARLRIAETCFLNGDLGHRQQLQQIRNQMLDCNRLLQGCEGWGAV